MKQRFLIFILLINYALILYGQGSIIGNYFNHFSSKLSLNSDFTYSYTTRFDLLSSWSKGVWSVCNDTLYLRNIAIIDTFVYVDTTDNGSIEQKTEMILSSDTIPEYISQTEAIATMLLSGGQNRMPYPEKLYYKRGKLFEFNKDGTLRMQRIKQFRSNKKYRTHYFKY